LGCNSGNERGAGVKAIARASELVRDDDVQCGQVFGDFPGFFLGLFLFEGIEQFNRREEANLAAVMFYRLDAEGGDMGFAGSRAADKHASLSAVHELAAMQGPDNGLVDLACGEINA